MNRKLRYTELCYDDAERVALYLSGRDNEPIEMVRCLSEFFPQPPKLRDMPNMVDAFKVGDYEIAFIDKVSNERDRKYRNRTLHRIMLGERLRDAREAKGISLDDVERVTGIRAKNIENIELGRYDASIDILGNIGDALGCHLDFVFND